MVQDIFSGESINPINVNIFMIIMLFVALLNARAGCARHLIRSVKNLHLRDGIEIEDIYGLFGDYDHVFIFKAESHAHADIFLGQFKDYAKILVRSATKMENLRWTCY